LERATALATGRAEAFQHFETLGLGHFKIGVESITSLSSKGIGLQSIIAHGGLDSVRNGIEGDKLRKKAFIWICA